MLRGRFNREPERLVIIVSIAPAQFDGGEVSAGKRTPRDGPEFVVPVRGENRADENVINRVRQSWIVDEDVVEAMEFVRRENLWVG